MEKTDFKYYLFAQLTSRQLDGPPHNKHERVYNFLDVHQILEKVLISMPLIDQNDFVVVVLWVLCVLGRLSVQFHDHAASFLAYAALFALLRWRFPARRPKLLGCSRCPMQPQLCQHSISIESSN